MFFQPNNSGPSKDRIAAIARSISILSAISIPDPPSIEKTLMPSAKPSTGKAASEVKTPSLRGCIRNMVDVMVGIAMTANQPCADSWPVPSSIFTPFSPIEKNKAASANVIICEIATAVR